MYFHILHYFSTGFKYTKTTPNKYIKDEKNMKHEMV